jgi:hypothetical protein
MGTVATLSKDRSSGWSLYFLCFYALDDEPQSQSELRN